MQSHEFPDNVSRTEDDEVSTSFSARPVSARKSRGHYRDVLAGLFVAVILVRYFHAHAVAKAGETAFSAPPPVDVVIARPATRVRTWSFRRNRGMV